ncbi:MAG: MerR family transcriptional regulator [Defluviitaleaceae bacterium]|nr:MerR family transcriptional regulator [Defluviitaleaceae bacterium]
MKQFSIKQVSEVLNISRDALRYYDELGLVSPVRNQNRYRHYTVQDMTELQFVQMLAFSGFSLAEIGRMFGLMRACDIERVPEVMEILKNKREYLAKRVMMFQSIIQYIDEAEELMQGKENVSYMTNIDMLVTKMYQGLNELKEELK